jgi:hypothetical protein
VYCKNHFIYLEDKGWYADEEGCNETVTLENQQRHELACGYPFDILRLSSPDSFSLCLIPSLYFYLFLLSIPTLYSFSLFLLSIPSLYSFSLFLLSIPCLLIYCFSPCLFLLSLYIPSLLVYSFSPCLFLLSLSIPSPCLFLLYSFSIPSLFLLYSFSIPSLFLLYSLSPYLPYLLSFSISFHPLVSFSPSPPPSFSLHFPYFRLLQAKRYTLVPCKYSGTCGKIRKMNIEAHEATCEFRPEMCKYCKADVQFHDMDVRPFPVSLFYS